MTDPQQPGHSKVVKTDWTKCCLCQKVTNELLQCPVKSKRRDVGVGQGYSTLSTNIKCLHELPMTIDLGRLDNGDGMEVTLMENKAMWHKSCHTKFNATKLQRAEKRKYSMVDGEAESIPSKKYTRRSTSHESTMDVCFFCEDVSASEQLREVTTFSLDTRVRKCAYDLQDQHLLAKLT